MTATININELNDVFLDWLGNAGADPDDRHETGVVEPPPVDDAAVPDSAGDATAFRGPVDPATGRELRTPMPLDDTEPHRLPDVEVVPDPRRDWFVPDVPVIRAQSRGDVKFFINGKDYCLDLQRELAGAREHIYLTGLHFMHDFGLVRTATANITLAQTLLERAERGVSIFLLVNLFWTAEQSMIGRWHQKQFRYFRQPVRRDSFGNAAQRSREVRSTAIDLGRAWSTLPPADRLLNSLIAANGFIERYFPATVDLFRVLRHPNIRCRLDVHPGHIMHSHHQKSVVIDDRISYVGGIDLTHIDGDRWDTSAHTVNHRETNRAEKYWHDIHGRIDGAGARRTSENFKDRWRNGELYDIVPGTLSAPSGSVRLRRDRSHVNDFPRVPRRRPGSPPPKLRRSDIRALTRPLLQFVRSMPSQRNYSVPTGRWEHTAKDAYVTGINAARELIYLENQWIADEDIWSALTRGALANRRTDYQIVLMMPDEPLRAAGAGANQDIFTELNILKLLIAAHSSRTVSMFSLVNHLDNDRQIYVHSKIMTSDDVWSLIGSANAGGISLEGIRDLKNLVRTLRRIASTRRLTPTEIIRLYRILGTRGDRPDTELSFITLDPAFANSLRTQVWREHLSGSGRSLTGTIATDINTLRQVADQRRVRLRNHPYLVSAFRTDQFPGIDLRIFGYSPAELQQRIGGGTQRARQEFERLFRQISRLPRVLINVQQELQRYEQPVRLRALRDLSGSVVPYLGAVMRIAPAQAGRIEPILRQFQGLGSNQGQPNA